LECRNLQLYKLYNSKINIHYTIDDEDLAKNRNMKVRIQILKRP
jgi:hypothetical protein